MVASVFDFTDAEVPDEFLSTSRDWRQLRMMITVEDKQIEIIEGRLARYPSSNKPNEARRPQAQERRRPRTKQQR